MSDSSRTETGMDPGTVLDTIRKHMLVDGFPIVVDLVNSKGARLKDRVTGKEYLDFFQFFASMPLGFNHPRVNNEEFRNYLADVAVNKPSNSDFYARQMGEFVDAMSRWAIP